MKLLYKYVLPLIMEPVGTILSSMVYLSLCTVNYVVDISGIYSSPIQPVRREPSRPTTTPTFVALPMARTVSSEDVGVECAICLEQYIEDDLVIVLQCDHRYHPTCIETWSRTGSTCVCPLCRKPIR